MAQISEPVVTLVAPPRGVISCWAQLAAYGDIKELRAQAVAAGQQSLPYAGFAKKIMELASQYRVKAIRELLDSHLTPKKVESYVI